MSGEAEQVQQEEQVQPEVQPEWQPSEKGGAPTEPASTNKTMVEVEGDGPPSPADFKRKEDDQEQETTQQETARPDQDTRPAGYNHVNFDELEKVAGPEMREAVESRINRLYGKVRQSREDFDQFQKDYQALQDQLRKATEERSKNVETLSQSHIDHLTEQAKAAAAKGDTDTYLNLVREVANKQFEYNQQKAAIDAEQKQLEESGNKQSGLRLSDEDKQTIVQYADTSPYMQNDHLRGIAIQVMDNLLKDPQYAHLDTPDVLAVTDEYIRTEVIGQPGQTAQPEQGQPQQPQNQTVVEQPQPQQPPQRRFAEQVLGNNYTMDGQTADPAASLSDEQKRVARRMMKGMGVSTPEEAYKMYAEGLK